MDNFGIYGIKPGSVLKTKTEFEIGITEEDYELGNTSNLPYLTIITVLDVNPIIETPFGAQRGVVIYFNNRKYYTLMLQSYFYEHWEIII